MRDGLAAGRDTGDSARFQVYFVNFHQEQTSVFAPGTIPIESGSCDERRPANGPPLIRARWKV